MKKARFGHKGSTGPLDPKPFLASGSWLDAVFALGEEDFCFSKKSRSILCEWIVRAREAWVSERKAKWRLEKLHRLFFSELGLRVASAEERPRAIYVQGVIEERIGNCLGLSMLYLAVAEAVGIPLTPVLADQHVFVRYNDGKFRRNIETTRQGADLHDLTYRVGGSGRACELEELSMPELFAALLVARSAYIHEPLRQWKSAIRDLRLAIELFPEFGAAQYNLEQLTRASDKNVTWSQVTQR